jgi:transposase
MDLRKRVVDAVDNGLTYEQAAEQFQVGRASVSRWLKLSRAGSLRGKTMGGSKPMFGEAQRDMLKLLVWIEPDATLAELCDKIHEEVGLRTSSSTVARVLQSLGLTRKKSRSSTAGAWTRT